jgi:chitin synthase
MLAAFLEWFLYLGAFLYCLGKAYKKAEHVSVRVLCLIIGFLFAAMRYIPLNGDSYVYMTDYWVLH